MSLVTYELSPIEECAVNQGSLLLISAKNKVNIIGEYGGMINQKRVLIPSKLWVSPLYRGQGIGEHMMRAIFL